MTNIDMRVPFEDLLQACEDLYTEMEMSKRRIAAELGRVVSELERRIANLKDDRNRYRMQCDRYEAQVAELSKASNLRESLELRCARCGEYDEEFELAKAEVEAKLSALDKALAAVRGEGEGK